MPHDKPVNYKEFRPSKINTKEFEHLKYLLYWPLFGIMFWFLERIWIRNSYTTIRCPLDDLIPFCEFFIIPYLFWFVFLVVIHIYTLIYDTGAFKKLMKFIAISYTIAIIIYILFPSCQELRPSTFQRNNVLTRFIAHFYQFDTNTNVCPSIHVIGSVAVMLCAWHSKYFGKIHWKIIFGIVALLISISTVFLKQHSVIDVIVAIPVCIIAYMLTYKKFIPHHFAAGNSKKI